MADHNEITVAENQQFCSELLSPSELFSARTRSHKIPVKGQKDFLPNGSEWQAAQLQRSLDEHWSLVAEERVERLENLVTGVWLPGRGLVELQSPAGKFWQTMGFSSQRKQYLYPEEALYLMECGSVQVFHRDLPLSIQEGYEVLLTSDTVDLQQYQVYGHLKRLGYVVTRFDSKYAHPSSTSVPARSERQKTRPESRERPSEALKRKRSSSPSTSFTDVKEGFSAEDIQTAPELKGQDRNPDAPVFSTAQEQAVRELPSQGNPLEEAPVRSWWVEGKPDLTPGPSQSAVPRWDFRKIPFPDLGSRSLTACSLASSDPTLLPGELSVGVCELAPWLQRLNLRQEKQSQRDRERERDRARYRRDVNRDQEVRHCRNWTEYRHLLERRSWCRDRDRPAHLWEQPVTPLHHPRELTSTSDLLEKIRVIQPSRLLDGVSGLSPSREWTISFNVYQPDTVAEFRKSSPGKPHSCMCVCSFDGPVPDLRTMKQLAVRSGDVPVTYAVVDHGDISFYSFKDFQLPVDVSH